MKVDRHGLDPRTGFIRYNYRACPVGPKICYVSEMAARAQLFRMRVMVARGIMDRAPIDWYVCYRCNYIHLTSQKVRPGAKVGRVKVRPSADGQL